METQLYYRPSGQKTADYLEHALGRKSGYARSQTIKDGDETSQGKAEQGIPLMTAQAIKQMKDEWIIGFHRRLPPFKMRRVDWRHHTDFIQKRQLSPPTLSVLPPLANIPVTSHEFSDDSYVDSDMILIDRRREENIRRLSN